jgi:hypothetical protein
MWANRNRKREGGREDQSVADGGMWANRNSTRAG